MTDFVKPFPESPLAFGHPRHRVRALFHGHLLADTDQAVAVRQDGQPTRFFFPRESVEMEALVPTDFTREYPDYGVARYFTIYRDRGIIEHAAWSFESPSGASESLRGLITFDVDVVQIEEDEIEDRLWDTEAEKMSDYIRHTDSGSGRSQDAPWNPTVGVASELLGEDEEVDDADDENLFNRGART